MRDIARLFSIALLVPAWILSPVSWSKKTTPYALPRTPAQESATAETAVSSTDTQSTACGAAANEPSLTFDNIKEMVNAEVPDSVILSMIQARKGIFTISPIQVTQLKEVGASDDVLNSLASGPEVYIGWSVLPSKVIRDNYGLYVMNKYFAIDVAIANRGKDSLIVTALEFCHDSIRDVSIDPVLVRGSLQKGQLAGRRNLISHSIQGVGAIASPSSAFFKNLIHRGTFSAGAALFTPLKTAFDLVYPDTILTYLENWDKDEVFKKGFVVTAGGSTRGRVFIPIELIYPHPLSKSKAKNDYDKWRKATKGIYDPEDVKGDIGILVVLGQAIQLKGQRRFVKE